MKTSEMWVAFLKLLTLLVFSKLINRQMPVDAALLPQWRENLIVVLSEVACESSLLF